MKEDTKMAAVVSALKGGWVPITALMAEHNWKRTTVRGQLSALKLKHGVKLERQRIEGVTSYRIAEQ